MYWNRFYRELRLSGQIHLKGQTQLVGFWVLRLHTAPAGQL